MRGPGPNDPCWCGSGKKYKKCHRDQDAATPPAGREARAGAVTPMRTVPPVDRQARLRRTGTPARRAGRERRPGGRIARMRRAGRAAAEVLASSGRAGAPRRHHRRARRAVAHEACIARGGYPSPLNYRGFPKSHLHLGQRGDLPRHPRQPAAGGRRHRQPRRHRLPRRGARRLPRHLPRSARWTTTSRRLVQVTARVPDAGHRAVQPGRPISDIGRAIEDHATAYGYGVVRALLRPRHRRALPHRAADPPLLRARATHRHGAGA